MGARGLITGTEITWKNAASPGLVGVEIWGGMANNLALAVKLTTVPVLKGTMQAQTFHGLTTGQTWHYWIRSFSGNGATSTWTPSDPLGGWSATVLGVDNNPYDLLYGETMQELRWLLEHILLEIRALREAQERQAVSP